MTTSAGHAAASDDDARSLEAMSTVSQPSAHSSPLDAPAKSIADTWAIDSDPDGVNGDQDPDTVDDKKLPWPTIRHGYDPSVDVLVPKRPRLLRMETRKAREAREEKEALASSDSRKWNQSLMQTRFVARMRRM